MKGRELEYYKSVYLASYNVQFYERLCEMYYSLCCAVGKRKGRKNVSEIHYCLRELIYFIYVNLDYIDMIPFEERYMIINVVKLAKSEDNVHAMEIYNNEKYQNLLESYAKSR